MGGYAVNIFCKVGHGLQKVGNPCVTQFSFCLDPLNNFVICDFHGDSIRVFSPVGNLLHMIGRHQQRMFSMPHGVTITPNGRLVCLLNSEMCFLIFCLFAFCI